MTSEKDAKYSEAYVWIWLPELRKPGIDHSSPLHRSVSDLAEIFFLASSLASFAGTPMTTPATMRRLEMLIKWPSSPSACMCLDLAEINLIRQPGVIPKVLKIVQLFKRNRIRI